MELYRNYLHRIQTVCNQLKGTNKKIIFLIEEKNVFRLNNKNDDADIVLQWFTDEIEKQKLLIQFDAQSKQNTQQQNDKSKIVYNSLGDIRKALNTILFNYRKTGYKSEAFIEYYNQINQPTYVKDIVSKELIPFENYFGAHFNKLNDPYTYWNGFYITPEKVDDLNALISDQRIVFHNNFVTDINEIADHIFAFRDGFIQGYNKFDFDEIEAPSSIFKSDDLSSKKVIDYLNENKINSVGNFTYHFPTLDRYAETFTEDKYLIPKIDIIPISKEICHRNQDEGICSERIQHNDQVILMKDGCKLCYSCSLFSLPESKKWKVSGLKAGKLYRAWYVVLSNYEIFDKHFNCIANQSSKNEKHLQDETANELSVPDWCIVFYYLDEAGTQVGSKIDRMKKFIEENNVVNPSGTHTTKDSFKNKYYEIKNRINGKNKKKPLLPERIEKVLPFLKNNKSAMQKAVSDIGYLNDEIEENERNTY